MAGDREAREKTLRKVEYELAELGGKLNTRKLKTKEAILEKVVDILDGRGVRRFFHFNLIEVTEKNKRQIGFGRPGAKTKFKTTSKKLFSMAYTRNRQALKEEKNVDGIFPLLSTDCEITAKECLLAYKYQPRLEKRFNQFRNVHNAAPLLFKKIVRVEAIMFIFFISLMIQAIIEREVRKKMKDKNILALPVYPEHRIAYHPTTAKIFDRFEGLLCALKYGKPKWLQIPPMRANPRIEVCHYADNICRKTAYYREVCDGVTSYKRPFGVYDYGVLLCANYRFLA